jgi:hypothetical protein
VQKIKLQPNAPDEEKRERRPTVLQKWRDPWVSHPRRCRNGETHVVMGLAWVLPDFDWVFPFDWVDFVCWVFLIGLILLG